MEDKFKTVEDVAAWLGERGFPDEVVDAFVENDMDGEAISTAFATLPGPDCIREVVPKFGYRLKVYRCFKSLLEESQDTTKDDLPQSQARSVDITPPSSQRVQNDQRSVGSFSSTVSTSHSTPKIIKETLPSPFPIPTFRCSTEEFLSKKQLLDGDRKYMVQTIATVLMTYKQRPSLSDCASVAQSLVQRYPFLADCEGTGEYSWKWFLYNRTQNVNRDTMPKRSAECPSSKRLKLTDNTQHYYPISIPEEAEDEESQSRNFSRLKDELARSKPSMVVLKELMMRTYPKRRKWIIQDSPCPSVTEILSDYPLLKRSTYVAYEIGLILEKPDIRDEFDSAFLAWSHAIIEYCKSTQVRSTALQQVTADFDKDFSSLDDTAVIALRCLALLFVQTKVKRADDDIPFIMRFVPKGTSPNEAPDPNNNQPHIILFKDEADDDDVTGQYFISIEQTIMMESSNPVTAIFNLLVSHYVFNLAYHPKAKDMLTFIQERMLGIGGDSKAEKKKNFNPLSSSHVSGIIRVKTDLENTN